MKKGLLLSLLFCQTAVWATSGTEGAAFLEIPVGARPAALGSAYSALATDAYAPTWNPAGLGFVDSCQVATQYLSYVESMNDEYASVVYPLRPGKTFGASLQYLGTGDIPETQVGGASSGNFSSHYAAYALAYGQAWTDRLSFGLAGKLINAQISDVSANAYVVDLGSLYQYRRNLSFAATLTNLGTALNFLSEGDSLPLAFHLAAAYIPSPPWTTTVEGVLPQAGSPSIRLGGEWRPLDTVSLRMGFRTDNLQDLSPLAGFSMGVGIHLWGQNLDYAWVPLGSLGNTQYISLVFSFGPRAGNAENVNVMKADQANSPSENARPIKNKLPPSLEYGAPEAPR